MTQASEPNPPTATVRMARPAALGIRNHRQAASTMATPRVSSPRPSRRWCGSRSRAPRPMARAANPTAPATSIQAAAIILPVQPTRITTGSRGGRPALGGRCPWAVRPLRRTRLAGRFPVARSFSSGAERVWLPCPCLRRGAWRAGDLMAAVPWSAGSGAASSSPPRGRADPLRARVAIHNRSENSAGPTPPGRVGLRRNHVVVAVRVAEAAPLVERAGRALPVSTWSRIRRAPRRRPRRPGPR